METNAGPNTAESDPGGGPRSPVPRIQSGSLFEGRTEVILEHRGEEYRLRVTKSGKLILTK